MSVFNRKKTSNMYICVCVSLAHTQHFPLPPLEVPHPDHTYTTVAGLHEMSSENCQNNLWNERSLKIFCKRVLGDEMSIWGSS